MPQIVFPPDAPPVWGRVDASPNTVPGPAGPTGPAGAAGGGVAIDPIFDAKGDLAVGTGADTAVRLPVGTNGQVLTVDSTTATGLKYATPTGGGGSGDVATDTIWDTKGDIAAATGADTAVKLPLGTNGQVLTVDTSTATGLKYATPSVTGNVSTDTLWDTKGDLAVATGADTASKLAAGANNLVLVTDSTTATGLKWAAVSAAMVAADLATQSELDTVNTALGAHVADTTAAHAASSIGFSPVGTISSTDVQAAIAEVSADVSALPSLTTSNTTKVPISTASGVTTLNVDNLLDTTTPAAFTAMVLSSSTAGAGLPALAVKHAADTRTTGSSGGAGIEIYTNPSHGARVHFWNTGGTAAVPAQTASGGSLGGVTWRGSTDGTTYSATAAATIVAVADENVTSTNKGAHMDLLTTPVGSGGVLGTVLRLQSTANYDASFRGAIRLGAGSSLAAPATGYALESILPTVGIGYGTGAGGAQTQATSRTTAVTMTGNPICGQITLFAAAPAVGTWTSFTVNNTSIRSTDTVRVMVSSSNAANKYIAHAHTIVNATSFDISVTTIVGTTSDSPVVNYSIFRAVAA